MSHCWDTVAMQMPGSPKCVFEGLRAVKNEMLWCSKCGCLQQLDVFSRPPEHIERKKYKAVGTSRWVKKEPLCPDIVQVIGTELASYTVKIGRSGWIGQFHRRDALQWVLAVLKGKVKK